MGKSYDKDERTNNEDLLNELKTLDNDTVLTILSLGDSKLNHLKLQKMVFLLSMLSNLEPRAIAYKYGAFDEYLMEKIQDPCQDFIKRQGEEYMLTEKGKEIYFLIIEKMKEKQPKIVSFSDIIRKVSDQDILAITYFLFPEYASNSEIYDSVKRDIELLRKRKSKFVVSKEDDDVIIALKE